MQVDETGEQYQIDHKLGSFFNLSNDAKVTRKQIE
jgi:hypothetical protein